MGSHPVLGSCILETPDWLSELGAVCQADPLEIDEVTIQSGPVPAVVCQCLDHLAMAQGFAGPAEKMQNCHSGRSGAQTCVAQFLP
jgi:hypothetical protein